jgi:hypothetical protein
LLKPSPWVSTARSCGGIPRRMAAAKARGVKLGRQPGRRPSDKSFAEVAQARLKDGDSTLADAVAMAKRLHRANPKTGKRLSLQKISDALAKAGHLNERGQPYNPKSVRSMIKGARPSVIS